MTNDFSGDALPNLALGFWIDRQDKIGMRFDIDKTRRYR
jgi:hypothetical protein